MIQYDMEWDPEIFIFAFPTCKIIEIALIYCYSLGVISIMYEFTSFKVESTQIFQTSAEECCFISTVCRKNPLKKIPVRIVIRSQDRIVFRITKI